MKPIHSILLLALLLGPGFLSAQSFVGSWTMSGTDENGQAITNIITFNDNGTMTVDFSGDGTPEIQANYTMDGDVISVSDTSDQSPCYGKVGQYRMTMDGDTLTATLVSDPCDARRSDRMVMSRK